MTPGDFPKWPQEVDLGYQCGWDDAMREKPPCACRGREPLARGYADPDTLADYNAGRVHMMTLFKVQALHTDILIALLADEEGAKE